MAMFRTGVKILRELSPKKGHCILPIRSISEERRLFLRDPACPTNSISSQNCIERSISWMSISTKKIGETTINSGLPLNAESSLSPISGKPNVGWQHCYYRPRGKTNRNVKIIKDGYVTCCEEPYLTSQGPPFAGEQNRRLRRNSKRPPFNRSEIQMSSNTAHYKPPYTEYKMAVDSRQPKMQGHFLKIYDVNEITVRSDSVAAHPNYVEHRRIGQTPSGKCLRSSKPIPEEVADTRKMEIPTEQSVYSCVNQGSFSKIPSLLEATHPNHRNISTAQGGKLNPDVQEVKNSTQDINSFAENPVCNLQDFPREKQINKNNFGYGGRMPSPSYSEMKKAELQNDSKGKSIFPIGKFNPLGNDPVLSQNKPFSISGKSMKYLCSEASVRSKFNGNVMKSREVPASPQLPNPNISMTPGVQSFSENAKSFSESASPTSKIHTMGKEQKTQPLSKLEDNSYIYDQHSRAVEAIAREMQTNGSKLKDASNNFKSEEFSINGKTRNLKKVQVNRSGREQMLAQKEYCKHESSEQKEYSTIKERHEPVYQQKVNFKDWQENGTQRGTSNNNYEKVEQANVESYSMNKANTENVVNANKENMSKGKDVEADDAIVKKSYPSKQKVPSLFASEEKAMQSGTKSPKDFSFQNHIPTTNVSHFLNIESVYDKHKFQNPFAETVAEETASDGLVGSRLTEVDDVIPNEKLTTSSDKNAEYVKQSKTNAEYVKQSKTNAETSDKSFSQFSGIRSVAENKFDGINQAQGGGKPRIIKRSLSKTNVKFPANLRGGNATQFGSRNYSTLANASRINCYKKIKGSIPQRCDMGTKHPKLGDLSAKDLPIKVPCGAKTDHADLCHEKPCKRVCVPGCLIPRQVECESEPAPPPPCVKVEAPQPSFSECLKCPPLPPYSKLTECHVEKPRGYYREYKGHTIDACNPPVVVGSCPTRNAFKRVKRSKAEYNTNCDKPPKYPCEVESTFPPSRMKPRDDATPIKCQSYSSGGSGSSLNKFTPTQVRFYSTGKLNSPLTKNAKNEADVKADSQPPSSCVYQTRCVHTPASFISCTTSQFNPDSVIKETGGAAGQNRSSCDQCGDARKYGHDIPLRYKYGDFFPSSTYRRTYQPHPTKTKRSVKAAPCSTSTTKKTECLLTRNAGPGYCGKKKSHHIPYYPSSPYRSTHPCKPTNSSCNPSCVQPPNAVSSCSSDGLKSKCSRNPPCQRPNCPSPTIKKPCSCGPPDVNGQALQMRCYSGTSFSGSPSRDSLIIKRHYSDIVPSTSQNTLKLTPPFLNGSGNISKFPNLERLKRNIQENELSNDLNQVEVFPNAFNEKEVKLPGYAAVNDMKCENEGCDNCKKPKCDRCEKKQCPTPQYKQCPKPPPKRRMCENMPKCPPKPGLKSKGDCHKPCCPDSICKATENAQVKMASVEKAASSKDIEKTSALQGLFNTFKSFMSLFVAKGTMKDGPAAVSLGELQLVKLEAEPAQAQESSQASGFFKPERNKCNFHDGLLSKTVATEYSYPFDKRTTK